MKTFSLLTLLVLLPSAAFSHGGAPDAVVMFRASLTPHGHWIVDSYGASVWQPACLPAGWQPYTVGRWVWTSHGWYWESDEPWGWATYHYGSWDYDPFHGWVWYPGTEWGPAWVVWHHGRGFVGWMPLRPVRKHHHPAVYDHHIRWNYVYHHDLMKRGIHHHLISVKDRRKAGITAGGHGRDIPAVADHRGPDRRVIERATGSRIQERHVMAGRKGKVDRVSPGVTEEGRPKVDRERRGGRATGRTE